MFSLCMSLFSSTKRGRGRQQRTYNCCPSYFLTPSALSGRKQGAPFLEGAGTSLPGAISRGTCASPPRSSPPLHLCWPFKALSTAVTLLGSSSSKAAVLGKAGLNHACPWEMSEPFSRLGTEDIKLSFWKLSHFSSK